MGEITKVNNEVQIFDYRSTIDKATELSKFVEERNLFSIIQGKKFVNVEGWQFAGMLMGVLPIVEEPKNLSTDSEIKYSASAKLQQIASGNIIGYGFALCSNKEPTKRTFQEYAIASMAQTRAVGKAYRNMLAFLMKASGFEPTPAEEMDGVDVTETHEVKPKAEKPKQEKRQDQTQSAYNGYADEIAYAVNLDNLKDIFNAIKVSHGKGEFTKEQYDNLVKLTTERKAELK